MAYIKILTKRDEFDGTTRCHSYKTEEGEILDALQFIDDYTPTNWQEQSTFVSLPLSETGIHRVFGEEYKKEFYIRVPQFVTNDDHLFSTNIIGWTTYKPREGIVLVSPRDVPGMCHNQQVQQVIDGNEVMTDQWMTITSNLRQTIFPVIVRGRNELPLLKVGWTDLIDTAYGYGQYLVLIQKSKITRSSQNLIVHVQFNNNVKELNRMDATLYYYRYAPPKFFETEDHRYFTFVNRILDPIKNPYDYPVFGMYCGGGTAQLIYQNQSNLRLCWDQSCVDVIDENTITQSRTNSFRTEISYDWRSLRIGYYCGRSAQLFVTDRVKRVAPRNAINSLLRESTFVIADGSHTYKRSKTNWKNQIKNMDLYIPLGPLIAFVTEGVSHLDLYQDSTMLQGQHNVCYVLENGCSRPLLINWIDFEKDLSPNEDIGRSFVEIQSFQFKQIMRREDFFDYLYFRGLRLSPNFDYRNDIVITLAESINFDYLFHCNSYWNCYALLEHTHYCYLGTFALDSTMVNGHFNEPFLRVSNRVKQLFEENIDYGSLEELSIEQNILRTHLHQWYRNSETQMRQSFLFQTCIQKINNIFQLRNPTIHSFLRNRKIRNVWKRSIANADQGDTYRRYKQRYWQIVKRRYFQDYILLEPFHEAQIILVMTDFPEPTYDRFLDQQNNQIIECVQMTEIWDVYGLLKRNEDQNKSNFYFMGSISYNYPVQIYYDQFGQLWGQITPNAIYNREEIPIEMENTIDRFWYPYVNQNIYETANQISRVWSSGGHIDNYLRNQGNHILVANLENPSNWSDIRRSFIENPRGTIWDGLFEPWWIVFHRLRNQAIPL